MPNLLNLPTMTNGLIRVVVETPRGSAVKLAYDPSSEIFEYVRPLPVGMTYPYDWGFIPSTLGEDGDPLDGLVLHEAATAPGVLIKCDLLGSLQVEQEEQGGKTLRNDRYILRPRKEGAEDERMAPEIPEHLRREIEQFFLSSVLGTGKAIKFKGWQTTGDALNAIKAGAKAFRR